MNSISATKVCQHFFCSFKKQGRYLGKYASNSLAQLVVEVYIKYYYWQGSVYDIILLFKMINHSLKKYIYLILNQWIQRNQCK